MMHIALLILVVDTVEHLSVADGAERCDEVEFVHVGTLLDAERASVGKLERACAVVVECDVEPVLLAEFLQYVLKLSDARPALCDALPDLPDAALLTYPPTDTSCNTYT